MTTSDSQSDDRFGEIVDEFVSQVRAGEAPTIEEYAQKHPEFSTELQEVLPMLILMEQVKQPDDSDQFAEVAESEARQLVGKQLGDYQIVRKIGRGGMGVVYEAEQISLGRQVALKILTGQSTLNEKQLLRFEREAKAAARLHHTNIVPVFGIGREEDLDFYVMQFINGHGLDDVLDELKQLEKEGQFAVKDKANPLQKSFSGRIAESRHKRDSSSTRMSSSSTHSVDRETSDNSVPQGAEIPETTSQLSFQSDSNPFTSSAGFTYWKSIAQIGVQVANALQYAHEQGITHRDIKPSNLLLDFRGTVWVTDFGLAKSDDQQNLTHTGDILGTLRYMPPEAFEGESDARSDVYSLGVTLYELVTLRPAFDESDRHKLIKKVSQSDVVRVNKINADVPRDLATIIEKAIEKDPKIRYQTAQELSEDLQRYLRDEQILARRASILERAFRWSGRNKTLAASLSGVALLLMIIAIGASVSTAYFVHLSNKQTELYEQTETLSQKNLQLLKRNEIALDDALKKGVALESARQYALGQERQTRRNLYYAHMSAAYESLGEHRGLSRTQSLIDRWRTEEDDLKHWEWYFINSLCNEEDFVLFGQADTVYGVDWSPDGKLIASAGSDGRFVLWDVNSKSMANEIALTFLEAYCVAWSHSGELLAIGGDDGVAIWDVQSEKVIHQTASGRKVFGVSWSPSDAELAFLIKETSDLPGEAQVISQPDWHQAKKITPIRIGEYTTSLDWDPTGQYLAVPSLNRVEFWVIHGEHEENPILVFDKHSRSVQTVAFNPLSKGVIASAGRDAETLVYQAATGHADESALRRIESEAVTKLVGHSHGIAEVKWNKDGKRLASAAWDGTTRIWDVESQQELRVLLGHPRHVFSIDWSPDGNFLATAGDGHSIKIWNINRRQGVRSVLVSDTLIWSFDFSPDGKTFCVLTSRGELSQWDVENGLQIGKQIKLVQQNINGIQYHPDGKEILIFRRNGRIAKWNPSSTERVSVAKTACVGLSDVEWNPVTREWALAGQEGTVYLWDEEFANEVDSFKICNEPLLDFSWSPAGTQFAVAGHGKVYVVNKTRREIREIIDPSGENYRIAWSSDGGHLAIAGDDHKIRVRDSSSGKLRTIFQGHNDLLISMAWSEDDRRVLSADARGTVKLWDPKTGEETISMYAGIGALRGAHWDHKHHRIAASCNGEMIIWDAAKGHAAEDKMKANIASPNIDQ